MEVKASLKGAKIGTLKMRPIAQLVRGKSVHQATRILSVQKRKGAMLLKSLIDSALANAENTKKIDLDKLYVKTVTVDKGMNRRSYRPAARGRAARVMKKSSHICVVLKEK